MNYFLLWNAYSFRKELMYVATAFVLVLSLPFIAIFAITHTGVEVVSDQLTEVSIESNSVNIKNPLNGEVSISLNGPFVWPTTGIITSEFGEIHLPYQPLHTGIDIAGKIGDPIVAFMKGKVTYAGSISWGYGKHVIIDHGNNVTSLYAHFDKIHVSKDQEVKQGEIIGLNGNTGWSTGPHLHFETRVYGVPVNPRVFLLN